MLSEAFLAIFSGIISGLISVFFLQQHLLQQDKANGGSDPNILAAAESEGKEVSSKTRSKKSKDKQTAEPVDQSAKGHKSPCTDKGTMTSVVVNEEAPVKSNSEAETTASRVVRLLQAMIFGVDPTLFVSFRTQEEQLPIPARPRLIAVNSITPGTKTLTEAKPTPIEVKIFKEGIPSSDERPASPVSKVKAAKKLTWSPEWGEGSSKFYKSHTKKRNRKRVLVHSKVTEEWKEAYGSFEISDDVLPEPSTHDTDGRDEVKDDGGAIWQGGASGDDATGSVGVRDSAGRWGCVYCTYMNEVRELWCVVCLKGKAPPLDDAKPDGSTQTKSKGTTVPQNEQKLLGKPKIEKKKKTNKFSAATSVAYATLQQLEAYSAEELTDRGLDIIILETNAAGKLPSTVDLAFWVQRKQECYALLVVDATACLSGRVTPSGFKGADVVICMKRSTKGKK